MGDQKPGARHSTTIIDIARAAGVSKSTVSLVLKGSDLVKPDTRQRVEEAIDRLGYVYNRGAANLRAASTSFVGVVIGDLTNPFFAELAIGIEDALYKSGFTPILANTNEDLERQSHVLRSLREHNVAGLIISPARGADAWTLASQLPRTMPTITTMRRILGSPLPYIGPDNRAGSREAVEHLLRLGHRRIAYVGGDSLMTTQQERAGGWQDALAGAGIPHDPSLIFEAPPTRAGGRAAVERALSIPRPPTAIVCYNDIVAMGATRALVMHDVTPGRDMAVVGFDDIAEAEHNAPPLTTVNADTKEMGARCADSLLRLIRGEDPAGLSYAGRARLIVRESCGAPRLERKAS
ncbi:MAG TPA: LacI family DNA-binding transcriptional regulator [Roseiarcus sp.]|nr:LacI family DNA-binding transcriptional regulator [Roseiarcus sp.]